ncbi:tetratricopeptide (TPR) repeat protein [Pseudomonas frederiksbergensis]|uniref:tetratricopeptide repeat protein n=1 Tax=Pseudomonas frederiksbergensis TaxID=104087 RepID=UPI003D1C99D2
MARKTAPPPEASSQDEHFFVNREKHLRQFRKLVSALKPGEMDLMVLHGIGGQGKSHLCHRLRAEMKTSEFAHVVTAHLDLHKRVIDPDLPLLWIRNELAVAAKMDFSLFDFGFALYWKNIHPDQGLPEFKGRKWLANAADVASDTTADISVDVFGDATDIASDTVSGAIQEASISAALRPLLRYGMRKVTGIYLKTRFPQDIVRLSRHMNDPVPAASLAKELPQLLAADLRRFAENNPERRFVFLIDEYERVFQNQGAAPTLHINPFDEAVRKFVLGIDCSLVVIFARERLPWELFPPAGESDLIWRQWIANSHHALDGLARSDAEAWLKMLSVPEPKLVTAMIQGSYESHGGAHIVYPYLLQLQVELYQTLKRFHQTPTEKDFLTDETNLEQRRRKILSRIVGAYDMGTQNLLKRLAVPRQFDHRTYELIAEHCAVGKSFEDFNVLSRLSFIQSRDDGTFTMPNLLREALLAISEPHDVATTQQLLWRNARDTVIAAGTFGEAEAATCAEAVHHGLAIEPRECIAWWRDNQPSWTNARTFTFIAQIEREIVIGLEMRQPEFRADLAMSLRVLGGLYQALGRHLAAIEALESGLALERRIRPSGSLVLIPHVMQLASLYRAEDDFLNAELLLDEALDAADQHTGTGITVERMQVLDEAALALEEQALYKQAESIRRDVLEIRNRTASLGSPLRAAAVANLMLNLASQGQIDAAAELVQPFIDQIKYDQSKPIWALALAVNVALRWSVLGRHDISSMLTEHFLNTTDASQSLSDVELVQRHQLLARACMTIGNMRGAADRMNEAIGAIKPHMSIPPAEMGAMLAERVIALSAIGSADMKGAMDALEVFIAAHPDLPRDIVVLVRHARSVASLVNSGHLTNLSGSEQEPTALLPAEIANIHATLLQADPQTRLIMMRSEISQLDKRFGVASPAAIRARLIWADRLAALGQVGVSEELFLEGWTLCERLAEPQPTLQLNAAVCLCMLMLATERADQCTVYLDFAERHLSVSGPQGAPYHSFVVSVLQKFGRGPVFEPTVAASETSAAKATMDILELAGVPAPLRELYDHVISHMSEGLVVDLKDVDRLTTAWLDNAALPQALLPPILIHAAANASSPEQAIDYQHKAVTLVFSLYGADNPATRSALIGLAKYCQATQRWADAHKWRKKALRKIALTTPDAAEFFAENAPDLAMEFLSLRNPQAAKSLLGRFADPEVALLSSRSGHWLEVLRANALALRGTGDLDQARAVAQELIATAKAMDEIDPSWGVLARCIAASLCVEPELAEEARRHVQQATELAQVVSPEFEWLRSNVQLEALRIGVCRDGNRLQDNEVAEILDRYTPYVDTPSFVRLLDDLAKLAVQGQNLEIAVSLLRKAVDRSEALFGENSNPHQHFKERLADLVEYPNDPNSAVEKRRVIRLEAATKGLRPLAAPDWPLPTSQRDTWRMVGADDLGELIGKVIRAQEQAGEVVLPERFKVRSARAACLGFYPGAELVEVLLEDEMGAMGCFGVICQGESVIVLSGASSAIHNFNLADHLALDGDPDRPIAYVRFYCNWLMGDEGPFLIVESLDDAPPLIHSAQRSMISSLLRPLEIVDGNLTESNHWKCEASMVYASMPFRVCIELAPMGEVGMLSDDCLSNQPVFVKWQIRSGARFLTPAR